MKKGVNYFLKYVIITKFTTLIISFSSFLKIHQLLFYIFIHLKHNLFRRIFLHMYQVSSFNSVVTFLSAIL